MAGDYTLSIMIDPGELGRAIKQLRERSRLSPMQVARRANVSTVFIYKVEAGERMPSWETLGRVAEALGVAVRISLVPTRRR